MMALDSAMVIIMAEVLLTMVVLAGVLFYVSRKKRARELKEINSFLNLMEEQALLKNQPLDKLLRETCGFDTLVVRDTLKNVSQSERELMQKIIQLFLQREMALLNEIDRSIGNLSEHYCQLLNHLAAMPRADADGNAQALERINQQLVRQLDTAMQTIDEITGEYTRVFAGNQSGLELENSSKKMLQIFQDSIRNIKQASRNP